MNDIILGDNLEILPKLPSNSCTMIYIDPPFNTGKVQKRDRITVVEAKEGEKGDRVGFAGKSYISTKIDSPSYVDSFDNFEEFLMPRIKASLHTLTANGSLFVHLNYKEVHYIKVALDKLLGRDRFINEIIWAYDYGARSKTRWPAKHDNILWYAMNPKDYIFNFDAIDTIPYLAPGLVGPEKAAKGKKLTDTWFNTIVPTMGPEKQGYPTQKPLKIIDRLVKVHSNEGDTILDFFCGSGTTGYSAKKNSRNFIMIDQSKEAIDICVKRLATLK